MNLENVTKIYNENKKNEVIALKDISISFKTGMMYGIMGESGSGKSTLVNILGLLDNVTSGTYKLNNKDISSMSEFEKGKIRNQNIGFVFQSYYLDSKLTAFENIELPLIAAKIDKKERKQRVDTALEKLGLKNRAKHYPSELSGGECQRIAIARALINNPKIIIADEPTGNLDAKNEKNIFETLKELSKNGKCVIIVSHSEKLKEYCDKVYVINKGEIKNEK